MTCSGVEGHDVSDLFSVVGKKVCMYACTCVYRWMINHMGQNINI